MVELISIHIPKTGGQSFYHVLQQVYGDGLSIYYRRRDYEAVIREHGRFERSIGDDIRVVHGHLYYQEVKRLHRRSGARLICWLRDPVERVVSNYHFFISRLHQPELNPEVARINAHRRDESLLEYAARRETRNRMSKFLKGLQLEDLFFIGFLEEYEQGLARLAQSLGWPEIALPHLNQGKKIKKKELDPELRQQLEQWNRKDVELYEAARRIWGRGGQV